LTSAETMARYLSESIDDHEGMVVATHLVWLRQVAEALVRNHLHAVRSLEIQAIWRSSRCHCHWLGPAP
jgi:hypothetical protein